jgi:hypothetical protein
LKKAQFLAYYSTKNYFGALPTRALGGERAPSCRAPQGHDQPRRDVFLIRFFSKCRLAAAASSRKCFKTATVACRSFARLAAAASWKNGKNGTKMEQTIVKQRKMKMEKLGNFDKRRPQVGKKFIF